MTTNDPNAAAVAKLLAAAKQGTDALMMAAVGTTLTCNSCQKPFMAVLGMQTGGRARIVCPSCKAEVFSQ